MGKNKKSKGSSDSSSKTPVSTVPSPEESASYTTQTITLREWLGQDRRGVFWVFGCIFLGTLLGFIIGTGWLEFSGGQVKPWRQELANRLRSTTSYRLVTFQNSAWDEVQHRVADWILRLQRDIEVEVYATNPSHPRLFAVLREAIIREKGGYVHPDLGFLVPAPSGASRGVGMVKNTWHSCQVRCLPGRLEEKMQVEKERLECKSRNESLPLPSEPIYKQEEILIRVPLKFQMTRRVALDTLLPLIPTEVQRKANMADLDDSSLLVLLLAHERGIGRYSRWMPYIASLPPEPSCGYSKALRPHMLDAIRLLRDELGVQTQGWAEELFRATLYAQKIVDGFTQDYGPHISTPNGKTASENIAWALCQVTSRATGASEKHGSLRMVPLVDQINHDENAGGFIELTGSERVADGDFLDTKEEESGTFVVRSLRYGRRKPLGVGQELLANYNVPHYAPLDWLVSMGFVPPERYAPWERVEPVLPKYDE